VRDRIERERAKHPPTDFARNDWTIDDYFDSLGDEVLSRPTPQGPEVVAVGEEEVLALKKSLSVEAQNGLKTFLDY
jgi:hypothetical protein